MKSKQNLIKLSPLTISILLALPVVCGAAEINISNGSVGFVKDVPVVDINKANSNGISHNVYDRLNVGKEGAIFNNSQNGVNTVLAGQIAGNANLTSGAAKVILNEVTSRNASTLAGAMEVAGDKAHLIIANPNGITCNTCSFINSEKVTLTTGKSDIVDSALKGYIVNSGVVTANGLTSDSPTEILARSIVVNDDIRVTNNAGLTVVAGNNVVDAKGNVVGAAVASGARNLYSVDVARLGGMYANKISLVSTENGVGVRNQGVISGGQDGVQITANGQLINDNAKIVAGGAIGVKTNGQLSNTTGRIASVGDIYIDTTKGAITNTRAGNILSEKDIYINSGYINNTNSKIANVGMLAVDTNGAELRNSGKGATVGIEAGIVALQTGIMNNSAGQIRGGYVGIGATSVNNTARGVIESATNVDISSKGGVDNNLGLLRSQFGHVSVEAEGNIVNRGKAADTAGADALGILGGAGGVQLKARVIDNSGGKIAAVGDVALEAKDRVVNRNGGIEGESKILINASALENREANISGIGDVVVELSGRLDNYVAFLTSEESDVSIKASTISNSGAVIIGEKVDLASNGTIDNNRGFIVARDGLSVSSENGVVYNSYSEDFGRLHGIYLGMGDQAGGMIGLKGVEVNAVNLVNNDGRIVSQDGVLSLNAKGYIQNDRGLLVAGDKASSIKADTLYNNYSTIHAKSDLDINVNNLSLYSNGNLLDNNATGIISSDGNLALKVNSGLVNYGWIVGAQGVSVETNGSLYNYNTIYSNNDALVSAANIFNYKDLVGDKSLVVDVTGTINNAGNIYSIGQADINASRIYNTNSNALIGGKEGLELHGNTITGNGRVVGL